MRKTERRDIERHIEPHLKALKVEGTTPHWYGKTGCRPGRKMGHVTIVADTMEEAMRRKAEFLGTKYVPSAVVGKIGLYMA